MDKIICRKPEIYPEITSCCRNSKHDLACIFPLYAGTHSELTSMLKYMYQYAVLGQECSEVGCAIKQIAEVEMCHMSLLAEAICKLGGDPKYYNPNTNSMWNAGVVCYERGMCKALLENLKGETQAHKAYLAAADKVNNPSLAALLRRIACDEHLHIEILTHLINCHCRHR